MWHCFYLTWFLSSNGTKREMNFVMPHSSLHNIGSTNISVHLLVLCLWLKPKSCVLKSILRHSVEICVGSVPTFFWNYMVYFLSLYFFFFFHYKTQEMECLRGAVKFLRVFKSLEKHRETFSNYSNTAFELEVYSRDGIWTKANI